MKMDVHLSVPLKQAFNVDFKLVHLFVVTAFSKDKNVKMKTRSHWTDVQNNVRLREGFSVRKIFLLFASQFVKMELSEVPRNAMMQIQMIKTDVHLSVN